MIKIDSQMAVAPNENPPLPRKWPALFHATIIACSLVVGIQIVRWELVSILTPFLEPLLEIGIDVLFALVLGWALLAGILGLVRHRPVRITLVSLGICAATFAIAWFAPFNEIELKASFRIHQTARAKIASEIVSGTYDGHLVSSGGRGDVISLLPGDQLLSDDGEAMVWHEKGQTYVLFFSYRGILDSFSGFVYSSNDRPPPDDAFAGSPVEVERWSTRWFWYASRN